MNISVCEQVQGKWRMEDGSRVAVRYRKDGGRVVDFYDEYPTFYIQPSSFRALPGKNVPDFDYASEAIDFLLDSDLVHSVAPEGVTIEKQPLYKVECVTRGAMSFFLRNYGPTWGGSLPQEDAVLIHNDIEVEDFDYHVCYFDIEALQFRDTDPERMKWLKSVTHEGLWYDTQMVNSIAAYSNFTKEYTAFGCHPNWERTSIKHEWGTEHRFTTEYDMLKAFGDWFFAMDFDVMTGWNSAGYDLPTLYHRMESLGIPHSMNDMAGKCENGLFPRPVYGAGCLSPYGIMIDPDPRNRHRYKVTDAPIRGVDTLDLMLCYERVYKDSTNQDPPGGLSLQAVAWDNFKEGKNPSPGWYDKDYDATWDEFLRYNIRDVELLVMLDEKWNIVKGYKVQQTLIGSQLPSTMKASRVGNVMFYREAWWRPKYRPYSEESDDEDDLQGAIILHPGEEPEERDPEDDNVYTNAAGMHDNVGMLDYAGLYPSVMEAKNISPETKVREGQEHLSTDSVGHGGVRFRTDTTGVLPTIVRRLNTQRDEYKALLKEAEAKNDKEAATKWNAMQLGVKRLRASMYGIMAFDKFAWFDRDVAASITAGGREALLTAKALAEKAGFRVIYGHTDSIFVVFPSEWEAERVHDEAVALGKDITKEMQGRTNSTAMSLDLEVIMDRFYLANVKGMYAGRKVWDDKKGFKVANIDMREEPWARLKMSGMQAKRTTTSSLGTDIQLGLLMDLFDKVPEKVVQKKVKKRLKAVLDGEVDLEELTAAQTLRKHLPHHVDWRGMPIVCDCGACPKQDAHNEDDKSYGHYWLSSGALWYNMYLAKSEEDEYAKRDKVKWVIVKDGPTVIPGNGRIAFRREEELAEYTIDWESLAKTHIHGTLKGIYDALGWDQRLLTPGFRHYLMSSFDGSVPQC